MRGKVRWLSFVYTLLFAIVTSHVIDVYRSTNIPVPVTVVSGAVYALMTCGNIMYSLRMRPQRIKRFWKILLPLFLFYFFTVAFVDDDMRHLVMEHPTMGLLVLLIWALLLAPAFWANYRVAYLKSDPVITI